MNERDIFTAANEMTDQAARAKFLDGACAGDPAMKLRVEYLLLAHGQPDSLLDHPAVAPHDSDTAQTCMAGIAASTSAEDEVALEFLAPPSRPDSLGRIGHYEVLQVLGQGGFGIVFRAFDDVLHRVVAVKVLSPQMAATSPARKRFLREARSSAQVRHENVVQVYEVGEQPLPYIAMEFIPGETLQQRLDRTGPIDAADVVRIGRQIAEGLAAAHTNDLVHRDIKPANILIEGGTQRVKITDFGLARAADDASISQSGLVAGTPMYMAPEQARGATLDQRADLFSLGSVLYVMAAGRPPFRANGTLAVLKRVAEDNPRPIREVIPETPQWLCDIISRLQAKQPEDRFQSAREVGDVLAECEARLKANAKLDDFPRVPQNKVAPAASLQSRQWKRIAVAIALLVLLAACGVWFPLPLSNTGELEILPEQGLVSVIVLQNDDGVIDGNKLHAPVTDWLNMQRRQTLTLPPGRYQLNVGTWPAGSAVGQWQVTTSGPFSSRVVTVPVVQTSAIITVERGRRVSLKPKMRPAPASPPNASTENAATQITEPDRRAAEYVLSVGGVVKVNDQEQEILAMTDLPREPFRLTYVDIRSVQLTDNGLARFSGCKNLLHLGLDVTNIDGPMGEVTDAGLAYFEDCKNLTSLSLNSRGITDAGLAYFKDCKNLTSLSLIMSNTVTDAGLLHFKECKNLTILSLNCIGVTGAGLVRLNGWKNLIDLNLYGTQVSDAGLIAFAHCQNLRNLNLGYTPVTDAGVVHFKDCKNLIDLSLYHTQVGDAGIAAFMDCKNLKNLNLSETQVGGVGLAQLKDCKELKILKLGDSKITDAGLASLKNFEGLTNLALWHTPVSNAGLAQLAEFDNLADLDLRYTKVTGRGLKTLAKVLPQCEIRWDGGVIEPNGGSDRRAAEYALSVGGIVEIDRKWEITALATLPKIVFRLTRVGLDNNPEVTDTDLAAFKDCQNLDVLELTGTRVTDAGLAQLAGLSELKNLAVAKTDVTATGIEELAKALPKCKITWEGGVIEPR
nr:serine/threonine-protein kinase PknD [uncultured bacterium]